jgi:hypothetical protein
MAEWNYNIAWNQPKNWRQRITGYLHSLLDRFDGRMTVSMSFQCQPGIPLREFIQCVHAGHKHTELLLTEILTSEACDLYMRKEQPELYRIEGVKQ